MAYVTEQTRAALAAASPGWAGLRRRWLRFAGQLPVVPLAILVPFVLVAVFANAIAPFDPTLTLSPAPRSSHRPSGPRAPTRQPGSAPTSRAATCSRG